MDAAPNATREGPAGPLCQEQPSSKAVQGPAAGFWGALSPFPYGCAPICTNIAPGGLEAAEVALSWPLSPELQVLTHSETSE